MSEDVEDGAGELALECPERLSLLLADVVGTDRHECVGGTIPARPAVAVR